MSMRSKLLAGVSTVAFMAALTGCDNSWRSVVVAPPVVAEGCDSVGDGKSFVGFTPDQQTALTNINSRLSGYKSSDGKFFCPSAKLANTVGDVINGDFNQPYIIVDQVRPDPLQPLYVYGFSQYVKTADTIRNDGSYVLSRRGFANNAIYAGNGYSPLYIFNPGDTYGDTTYVSANGISVIATSNTANSQLETDMVAAYGQGAKVHNQYLSSNWIGGISDTNTLVEILRDVYGIVPDSTQPTKTYDASSVVDAEFANWTGTTLSGYSSFSVAANTQFSGKQFIRIWDGAKGSYLDAVIMLTDNSMAANSNGIEGLLIYGAPESTQTIDGQFIQNYSELPNVFEARTIKIDNTGFVTLDPTDSSQATGWLTQFNKKGDDLDFRAENHKPTQLLPQSGKHKGAVELAQLMLPAPELPKRLLTAKSSVAAAF